MAQVKVKIDYRILNNDFDLLLASSLGLIIGIAGGSTVIAALAVAFVIILSICIYFNAKPKKSCKSNSLLLWAHLMPKYLAKFMQNPRNYCEFVYFKHFSCHRILGEHCIRKKVNVCGVIVHMPGYYLDYL